MASELDISLGILKIAASKENGIATFHAIRKEIPHHVKLDAGNLAASNTRHGEPMWHQIARNVKSHDQEDDNYIARGLLQHVPRIGYRITPKGAKLVSTP
tara:strand:- start:623 stop:922 length:300 start_codon:yes stop_codon:yes gene_type:complete